MFNYLVNHALKNVWCTPHQDLQAIVKPARLTKSIGVFNKVDVLWRTETLPLPGVRFHVYQIGQLHPLIMGLFPQERTWISLAAACTQESLITDVYANSGVQLPRCECWYMITADKNLILAVKDQPRIPIQLGVDDIFFRVYSNAYFNSLRADSVNDIIQINGKTITNTNDILTLQNTIQTLQSKPGKVYAFVNGFKVSGIDLFTTAVGDVAEYVYDSSIYKTVDFVINDLPTFVSLLDNKHKYLLHYPGFGDGTIDFYDDIDIYLLKNTTGGRHKGIYYHRNQDDAVRMLTHKDYAIPVPYLTGYASYRSDWVNLDGIIARLHVRKSGYARAIVNEHNRIKELYKLSDTHTKQALLGVDSVVANWRAEALENAAYPKLMRFDAQALTPTLVQDAYGYNAISKLLCDTPTPTHVASTQNVIDVPYGLQAISTAYEYDEDGLLLNWFTHTAGAVYAAHEVGTTLVEMIAGQVSTQLGEIYGTSPTTLDPQANYRMYLCPIVSGTPTNQWVDVTGTNKYVVINNVLTWLVDLTLWYPLVRSDKVALGYTAALPASDGFIRFSLTHQQLRNGVLGNYVMQIPMGELDLFLNGRSLIEDLDYIVQFPEIVIINKKYLINPATTNQQVTVRFTGFCKADLTRPVPGDRGFIEYELLSRNNQFDIRDDKVMRITVDGQLYHRSELKFSESDSGVTIPNALNGVPYLIRDIVVPMRGLTTENTYSLRAKSLIVDKSISDYMTLKIPEPVINTPSVIAAEYPIVSPFFCKILSDLENGILDDAPLKQFYNDIDVRTICAPYEFLLAYDPTQEGHQLDERFVIIHPYNTAGVISISIYYYRFLARVNKLYLHDKVEMSHFIQLTA